MNLVLGVLDVLYADASNGGKATSTGDVAQILEARYSVMTKFFELNQQKIAELLAESAADALQDLVNGGPVKSITFTGEQKIEALFRSFIYSNTMQQMLTAAGGGVLSQAAQDGVSSRRKQPYKKRKPRPAFVDSGLFVQSFRAWVSER